MSKMRSDEKHFVKLLGEKLDERKEEELCKSASAFVNSFGIHEKEMISAIADDLDRNEQMTEIAWNWIYLAAERSRCRWNYDERNETSYEICRQLACTSTGAETRKYAVKKDTPGYRLAEYMSKEHRTLQQTFTGFVFMFMTETNEVFRQMTKEAGYEKLGRLALI